MDLKITYRPTASLVPYAQNSRTHTERQIDLIARSISEFGFTNPVLISEDDEIIAGHARTMAAEKLRMDQVPCIILGHLTQKQRRALVIADNKIAQAGAGWNDEVLSLELGHLGAMGFDLSLTGFDMGELDHLLALPHVGDSDPDSIPESPAVVVTRPGDVWVMGEHRICCGDSAAESDIERLMAGHLADVCFTSPPYSGQRRYGGKEIDDWDALMQRVFRLLPVTEAAQVLVNLGLIHKDAEVQVYWTDWIEWMRENGWRRFGWYVWDQGPGLSGDFRGRLAPAFEFVFHFNREPARVRKTKRSIHAGEMSKGMLRSGERTFTGLRAKGATPIQATKKPDSVIRITRHKGSLGKGIDHPAVFPIGLPNEIVPAYSDPGDLVFEPFAGAGTTILSAQATGRACFAMELQPRYVDIAVIRWQRLTGQVALRESDQAPFTALAAAA